MDYGSVCTLRENVDVSGVGVEEFLLEVVVSDENVISEERARDMSKRAHDLETFADTANPGSTHDAVATESENGSYYAVAKTISMVFGRGTGFYSATEVKDCTEVPEGAEVVDAETARDFFRN